MNKMLDGYRDAVDAGVSLHWLKPRDKAPASLAWQSKPTKSWSELSDSYADGYNIGLRTGAKSKTDAGYVHVIDLDIRDEGKAVEAHAKLREIAPGYKKLPTVISGSEGASRHYYFVASEPLKMDKVKSEGFTMIWDDKLGRDVKKHDWEIDLLGTGRQVVIPPSIHPKTGKPYRWLTEFPWDELNLGVGPTIEMQAVASDRPASSISDDLLSMVISSRLDIDESEISSDMDILPNDDEDYDSWLEVGMGLHHQFAGSERGRKFFHEWSSKSSKYDKRETDLKWNSFKESNRANPITYRTIKGRVGDLHVINEIEETSVTLVDSEANLAAKTDDLPDNWESQLDYNEDGQVKSTMPNFAVILKHDLRLRGVIGFNKFTHNISVRKTPPQVKAKKEGRAVTNLTGPHWVVKDTVSGVPWQDIHTNNIRMLLERKKALGGRGLKTSDRDILSAILNVSYDNQFHPIIEMLEALPRWDGITRVPYLWIDYLGAEDNAYHRKTAMLFLMGAVARVYEPGCKFDYAPILEGVQGARKSTFIETLAMGFYGELGEELTDQKLFVEATDGKWILEIPELQGFNRHDIGALKGVMSRKTEQIRRPWAKFSEPIPRQNVMIGSTNDSEYLRDPTGGRRFWPIRCNKTKRDPIDIERLKDNLAQIWAEALTMYRERRRRQPHDDLPLYLDDEESMSISEELQSSRTVETSEQALAGEIQMLLDEPIGGEFDDLDDGVERIYRDVVCGKEIWIDVLGRSARDFNKAASYEIADAMKLVKGWVKESKLVKTKNYGPQRVYRRTA